MDKIRIKGYKSFKNLDVNLRKINIFIGANGAGKSNFLSVFEFLNAIYQQRLSHYVSYVGSVDKLLYNGRKVTEQISLSVVDGGNSYDLVLMESDGTLKIEQEGLTFYAAEKHSDVIEISKYKDEAILKDYAGALRGQYIKEFISDVKKYHFHDTGRKSPFMSESDIVNDSYSLYSQGQNLAAILYRIRTEKPMIYKRIIAVIQSVAPYFLDFVFKPTEGNTIRLQWNDQYSEQIYGPNDLSDGTIRFIALAVLFLQPWSPSVIIIDEPELGLHPVAIEKLAGLIHLAGQRGIQVIIATQSAELISFFEPEDILTVNQRQGESTVSRLNVAEFQQWLDDYTLGDLWKQNIVRGGQPR